MKRMRESEYRRYNSLLSKNRIWAENKVYSLSYHNTDTNKPYIILNPEVFKNFQNEIIVISFKTKTEIKLIFKITKENLIEQARKNISIHKNIVDLIIKKYNFIPKNAEVYVRKADKEILALTEIQIELKEYIPRSEIFYLTLNMLNDCVIKGQEIYNKDNKVIGVVSKLSNDSLTGLVTFSTNFKLTSLMSDIYLIFDISKSSYNYNSYFYLNYEVIIDYVKNLLLKLKSQTTYHNIHIFFYVRIFFKGNRDYEKIHKFVRKVPNEEGKFYIDIYDKIEMFNAEHIEFNEVIYKMNKIYQNYENIQNEKYQKLHYKNLNEFLFSIRKNLQSSLDQNDKTILELNKDKLSYTFKGYENGVKTDKECVSLDDNIFEEVNEFEISSFKTIGIFEALIFLISQIGNNIKNSKIKKYCPLINIVLSGESFPYYSRALADKVRTSIYGEYINLIFTYLCPKNKVSIFSKKKLYDNIYINNITDNDQYYEIDNLNGDIPNWCKIFYVPHSLLYKNLQKYKKQYKISLLQKTNYNLDEFHDLHKVFDEKLCLDIISLHFKEQKNTNGKNDTLIKNVKKVKKKLNLEDIIQRYTIKKNNYENYDSLKDKRDSFSSEENLKYNLENSPASNNVINWKHDLLNEESKDNTNENTYFPQINTYIDLAKTENEIDILEDIIINVPIPYFVEYKKDLSIIPNIIKCYVVKNDIELILKRIDHYFNIIVDNEKDEIIETIKNMIAKPSNNSFHEKFMMTNRKIMNILEFKGNQVEVLEYNIMRKTLYFQYHYLIVNSINGSVFGKTNIRNKAINWQEKDNLINKGKKFLI